MVDISHTGTSLTAAAIASVFLFFSTKLLSPPQDHNAHGDNFRVIGPHHPILVNVGEDALLTCQLLPKKNAMNMEVTWYRSEPNTPMFAYRDGAEVTEMQMEEYRGRVQWIKDKITEGHVALKMYKIQPSDDGKYWCHFQEENYQGEASLQLQVLGVGSSPNVHMQGCVESDLQLLCTSKGWFPEPEVNWKGNTGEQLPTFSKRHLLDEDGLFYVESTLVVKNASLENVSCFIHSHELNEKSSTIFISEKTQTELGLGTFPLITMERPKEGEILLTCTSEGWFPQPYVQWKDMEGNSLPSYSEELYEDSHGLFQVKTLLLKTDSDVNVTCSISNTLLDKEKMVYFYTSDSKVTTLWNILPYVVTAAMTGGALILITSCTNCFFTCLLHLFKAMRKTQLKSDQNDQEKDQNDPEKEKLQEKIEKLQKELDRRKAQFKSVWRDAPLYADWRKEEFKMVNVILDAATAHSALLLSEKGKRVTCQEIGQDLPSSIQRFDSIPCVLGQQGITSGRHYWEVEVMGSNSWDLGICRDNVTRKGKITVSPQNGFWVIRCYDKEYWSLTSPETHLTLNKNPLTVGIFVDYEAGEVAFYNMTDGSHIYTFAHNTFYGVLKPLFRLWSSELGSLTVVCMKNED